MWQPGVRFAHSSLQIKHVWKCHTWQVLKGFLSLHLITYDHLIDFCKSLSYYVRLFVYIRFAYLIFYKMSLSLAPVGTSSHSRCARDVARKLALLLLTKPHIYDLLETPPQFCKHFNHALSVCKGHCLKALLTLAKLCSRYDSALGMLL
jgi:hypothetical protein